MNELKDLYRQYCDILSQGDNAALESMLDDHAIFRICNHTAVGKKNVLLLMGTIFFHQANNGVVFKHRSMTLYQNNNTIVAEIEWQGFVKFKNQTFKANEADFVTFNDDHKILSVRSYQNAIFDSDFWITPKVVPTWEISND